MQFWSVGVVPRYLNFATSSKDLFACFMLYKTNMRHSHYF
jgi:hypothetical protein